MLLAMTNSRRWVQLGAAVILAGLLVSRRAAAQTATTSGAFWPSVEVHAQLRQNLRLAVLGEIKDGEDYSYNQWRVGAGIGYQMKSFTRPHLVDIDPEKEHKLVFSTGYEYIASTESSKPGIENRIMLGVTLQARPPGGFLVSDRNQFEFRWVNGVYSNRYRNRVTVERVTEKRHFRFAPYLSAEFFYDLADGSWNQEQYAVGITWPYKDILKLNTYYLYQVCATCSPNDLNVLGVTLNYFFRNTK